MRTRTCNAYCDAVTSSDLSDTGSCNQGNCPAEFNSWTAWSVCDMSCGDGSRTRSRTCSAHCSNLSSSDTSETESCNDGACKSSIVHDSKTIAYRSISRYIKVHHVARLSPRRVMLPAEFTVHQQLEIPALGFVK